MFDLFTAVVSLPSEYSRYCLAFLTEVRSASGVADSVSDYAAKVVKKDRPRQSPLQNRIDKSIERSRPMPDEEIRYRLISGLAQVFGVSPVDLVSPKDLDHVCNRVTDVAISTYRQQHPGYAGIRVSDFVRSVCTEYIGAISAAAADTDEEKETLADWASSFLGRLAPETQGEIRKSLDVIELDKSTLHRLVSQGAVGTVYSIAMDVAGQESYPELISLLNRYCELLSAAVPVSPYSLLTPIIAAMSSPALLPDFLGGGGLLDFKKGERAVKERLAPLVVALTVLDATEAEGREEMDQNTAAILGFWASHRREYLAYLGAARDSESKLAVELEATKDAQERKARWDAAAAKAVTDAASVVDRLVTVLEGDPSIMMYLSTNGPGQESAARFTSLSLKRSENKRAQGDAPAGAGGLFARAKLGISSLSISNDMNKAIRETAVEVVSSSYADLPDNLATFAKDHAAIMDTYASAKNLSSEAAGDADTHLKAAAALRAQIAEIRAAQKGLEKSLPDLGAVCGDPGV